MCDKRDNFNTAVKNLICIKPNIIFLTGKSGNGKTYFSNILKNKAGYKVLEMDIIV